MLDRIFPIFLTVVILCVAFGGVTFFQHNTDLLFDIPVIWTRAFTTVEHADGTVTALTDRDNIANNLNTVRDVLVFPITAARMVAGLPLWTCDSWLTRTGWAIGRTFEAISNVIFTPKEGGDPWY